MLCERFRSAFMGAVLTLPQNNPVTQVRNTLARLFYLVTALQGTQNKLGYSHHLIVLWKLAAAGFEPVAAG